MTILYFTSTGNCLMAARKIGGEKGKLLSIPVLMRKEQLQIQDNAIGLVFPVYGLSVPPIILEFIQKAKLKAEYLFAVLTYGTYDAGTAHQFLEETAKHKMNFQYVNTLHMQENYLPGFAMEKQKTPSNQAKKLEQIRTDIENRKVSLKQNSGFDRFMTRTHQKSYHYNRGVGVTGQYQIDGNCQKCGICGQICPTKNIKIENEKVVFGADCLSCLSCIQNCPQKAIHLVKEKSAVRYRNPEISLADILEANS
ncbi:MAG: EFR1 family ferrodoxin [Lachnospiraceae bacterium]|nr:EFR1 family ferrodoxin [Lachnospiraceae bacterium]